VVVLLRDGGAKQFCEDPIVGPCPKVWTRGQKWLCVRWRAAEAQMRENPEVGELDPGQLPMARRRGSDVGESRRR